MARLDSSGRANTVNTLALENRGANQIFVKALPRLWTIDLEAGATGAPMTYMLIRHFDVAEAHHRGTIRTRRLRSDVAMHHR